MNQKPAFNLKAIIITACLLFTAIIGISIYFIIDNAARNVSIQFLIAPASATITLNEQTFVSSDFYHIRPGDYHLTIKKDGFTTFEDDITLAPNDTVSLSYALDILPGNENYYQTHPNEAYAFETIWTDQMILGSETALKNNPLLRILPITVQYYVNGTEYVYYQISFDISNPNDVIILINDYSGGNYETALERIRTEGFDPSNYHIDYRDLSSEITATENF